jgi:hypothetical protein
LLIEEKVIIELKAAKALDEFHMSQCFKLLEGNRSLRMLAGKLRQAQD